MGGQNPALRWAGVGKRGRGSNSVFTTDADLTEVAGPVVLGMGLLKPRLPTSSTFLCPCPGETRRGREAQRPGSEGRWRSRSKWKRIFQPGLTFSSVRPHLSQEALV